MRRLLLIALCWSAAFVLPAEVPLPAFAIYHTVDAATPNAQEFSFKSVDGKEDITGWFVTPPLVMPGDVYDIHATTVEYGSAPCPGLSVRLTNSGNNALKKMTSKEEGAHCLIVVGGKPVHQIDGGELKKIGTLRLRLLITLPLNSGELNETLVKRVNAAMKAHRK
ncbi:hypothetical protein [Roseimicrobium sp. ORNL1]|uniref:hypothetical protein n=1 Tax=Roseimicrobium sp. ORNL1 TaxID=2711231 RepID=UPI0013E1F292|nr:hypothetical protein [Roseimicrobium sp. ORNL1]QIF01110.1 hypothetical protein G5S37_06115 [Roseimicrobium sp. ORNL1]